MFRHLRFWNRDADGIMRLRTTLGRCQRAAEEAGSIPARPTTPFKQLAQQVALCGFLL